MEVHVTGGIDEVEHIVLALVMVVHRYSRGLYGDAAFTLDIHIVEELVFLLTVAYGTGDFQYAVGQRAFTVVDMRDYRKISYVFGIHKV
jgi:hypothetical protein